MGNDSKKMEECSGRFLAIISYIGIFCLIPFIIRTQNKFVLYHARQGLVLWIWEVLAWIAVFVPFLGQLFFSVSFVLCILFSIGGMVQAALGRCWEIPIVGKCAEGF